MSKDDVRKSKDVTVLKRIHGLIQHSPDPQVQRAAGIAKKEIQQREVKQEQK